jgi:hypothetical protein
VPLLASLKRVAPFPGFRLQALESQGTEIEVAFFDLGNQVVAEWLPLLGISHDPKDDIVEIALVPWFAGHTKSSWTMAAAR